MAFSCTLLKNGTAGPGVMTVAEWMEYRFARAAGERWPVERHCCGYHYRRHGRLFFCRSGKFLSLFLHFHLMSFLIMITGRAVFTPCSAPLRCGHTDPFQSLLSRWLPSIKGV